MQLLVTNEGVAPALITLSLRADPPPVETPPVTVPEPSPQAPAPQLEPPQAPAVPAPAADPLPPVPPPVN